MYKWIQSVALSLILLVLPVIEASVAQAGGNDAQKTTSWTAYKNKRLGFTVYYPSEEFVAQDEPAQKHGRVFMSQDGKARIAAFGMIDPKWLGAELYDEKRILEDGRIDDLLALHLYEGDLREEGGAYETVSDKNVQKNWLTITGTRGDRAYFEKFIFSCKDKVISALSFTYPVAEADKYKRYLKTVVRRFGAGSGSETPRCL